MDRMREAMTARMTGGLPPAALALALYDWSIHLASAPGKRHELASASTQPDTPPCIEPLPGDHRFKAEGWKKQP